jgi:hypothetical protein
LPLPVGARYQHHAVRQIEAALDALPYVARKAELVVVEFDRGAVEDAEHDGLAVQ